jgi:hypothetical protein
VKLDNLEDKSVIWMRQLMQKNLTAAGGVIKEQTIAAKLDNIWI